MRTKRTLSLLLAALTLAASVLVGCSGEGGRGGTVTINVGLTSAKACAMMAGDGRRVRKNRWQP